MSKKSGEEWTQKEAKEWFEKKIAEVNELKVIMRTRMNDMSETEAKRSLTLVHWSYAFASLVWSHLEDIYGILDEIVEVLYETEEKTSKITKQLGKLNKIVKKPVFSHIEKFLKDFEKATKNQEKSSQRIRGSYRV